MTSTARLLATLLVVAGGMAGVFAVNGTDREAATDGGSDHVSWAADPGVPGPDLPPSGRSLFDHLMMQTDESGGHYRVPYPLPALIERVRGTLDEQEFLGGTRLAVLQRGLSGEEPGSKALAAHEDYLGVFTSNWRRPWPDGLRIAQSSLPDRTPVGGGAVAYGESTGAGVTDLIAASLVPAELDPLTPRPAREIWRVTGAQDAYRFIPPGRISSPQRTSVCWTNTCAPATLPAPRAASTIPSARCNPRRPAAVDSASCARGAPRHRTTSRRPAGLAWTAVISTG